MNDSDIFATGSAGGGAKLWTALLAVEQYASVISPVNGLIYRKKTATGVTGIDPAFDRVNYNERDGGGSMGSMRTFNSLRDLPNVIVDSGRTWLATGTLALASAYPGVPDEQQTLGDFWEQKTTAMSIANVVVQDYAGSSTTGIWLAITRSNQIYRSTDNMETWTLLGTSPSTETNAGYYYRFAIATDGAGRFWLSDMSAPANIFVTTNNGNTWTLTKSGLGGTPAYFFYKFGALWFMPAYNSTGAVLLYKSTDNGVTWTTITGGSGTTYMFGLAMISANNFMVISTNNPQNPTIIYVWVTINGGASFTNTAYISYSAYNYSNGQQEARNQWLTTLYVDDTEGFIFAVGSSSVQMTNGGSSYINVPYIRNYKVAPGSVVFTMTSPVDGLGYTGNYYNSQPNCLKFSKYGIYVNSYGPITLSKTPHFTTGNRTAAAGTISFNYAPNILQWAGDKLAVANADGKFSFSKPTVGFPTKIVTAEGLVSYVRVG